jgi:hypothetical protein
MNNKPNHRIVQMRVTPEELKRYKKALADLDMTATEFLNHSVNLHHQNQGTNND